MKRLTATLTVLALVLVACSSGGSTTPTTEAAAEQIDPHLQNLCADEGRFYQAMSEIAEQVTEKGQFKVRFAHSVDQHPGRVQTGFAFSGLKAEYVDFSQDPDSVLVGMQSPGSYAQAYLRELNGFEADTVEESLCAALRDALDRFSIAADELSGDAHMGVDTFLDRALPLLANESDKRVASCDSVWHRAHLLQGYGAGHVTLVFKEGQHASGQPCGGLFGAHWQHESLKQSFYGVLHRLGAPMIRS